MLTSLRLHSTLVWLSLETNRGDQTLCCKVAKRRTDLPPLQRFGMSLSAHQYGSRCPAPLITIATLSPFIASKSAPRCRYRFSYRYAGDNRHLMPLQPTGSSSGVAAVSAPTPCSVTSVRTKPVPWICGRPVDEESVEQPVSASGWQCE